MFKTIIHTFPSRKSTQNPSKIADKDGGIKAQPRDARDEEETQPLLRQVGLGGSRRRGKGWGQEPGGGQERVSGEGEGDRLRRDLQGPGEAERKNGKDEGKGGEEDEERLHAMVEAVDREMGKAGKVGQGDVGGVDWNPWADERGT